MAAVICVNCFGAYGDPWGSDVWDDSAASYLSDSEIQKKVRDAERRISALESENEQQRILKRMQKNLDEAIENRERKTTIGMGYIFAGFGVWGIITGGFYGVTSGLVFGILSYGCAVEVLDE